MEQGRRRDYSVPPSDLIANASAVSIYQPMIDICTRHELCQSAALIKRLQGRQKCQGCTVRGAISFLIACGDTHPTFHPRDPRMLTKSNRSIFPTEMNPSPTPPISSGHVVRNSLLYLSSHVVSYIITPLARAFCPHSDSTTFLTRFFLQSGTHSLVRASVFSFCSYI